MNQTIQSNQNNQPNAPVSFAVESQNPPINQASDPQIQQEKQQDPPAKDNQPFKVFASQEDFDNEVAKIRGVYEHKAEASILKQLGLKPEDKDKLTKFKEAYEASLTEKEKQDEKLRQLDELERAVAEKDAIITALAKLSGKTIDDVLKYVKMAKGLVSDEVTIEQALDEVMDFTKAKPKIISQPLNMGSDGGSHDEKNPFEKGNNFNLTKAGELIKQDINKARELAKKANYPINF